MFEPFHPQLFRYEQQQLEQKLERRRFIADHPEQVVPRPDGALQRMLKRKPRRGAGAPAATQAARTAPSPEGVVRGAPVCSTAPCEPAITG